MLNPGLTEKSTNSLGESINPATEETLVKIVGEYEVRLIESGVYTYVGKAAIGSLSSSAVWQIKRMDETSGLIILWADGDALFNNIWDNYATISYS